MVKITEVTTMIIISIHNCDTGNNIVMKYKFVHAVNLIGSSSFGLDTSALVF